jgi:hypothetical protein
MFLPLDDQEFAGALMWVSATFAYLIPAVVLTAHMLSSNPHRQAPAQIDLEARGSMQR